jgi:hypothetical protein
MQGTKQESLHPQFISAGTYMQPNTISVYPGWISTTNQTWWGCMRRAFPGWAWLPDASQAHLGNEPITPIIPKLNSMDIQTLGNLIPIPYWALAVSTSKWGIKVWALTLVGRGKLALLGTFGYDLCCSLIWKRFYQNLVYVNKGIVVVGPCFII